MNKNRKKILVTGGAGFIGSHLCTRLIHEGHHVVCLDNFFTGSQKNIKHLQGNSRFELVQHDIINDIYVEADEIYNLACPASPVHYQYDPIQTSKTSVLGAIHMLELAARTHAKILQASTSEVYGDPIMHPQSELYRGNVNPIGVRSCYDEGKRCAETLFMDYHRQKQVNVKIIRIFNTYGPHMSVNDGRVISNFIVQALRNEDITIYGNGTQTRSFQYIDDLLKAMLCMMQTEDGFTGPVNIGNPEEFSIRELAETVIALTGSRSKIVYLPLPQDDPTRRRPDISLATKYLGDWKPTVKLEEGLHKTIDYFRRVMENRKLRETQCDYL